jgi:hypothetical protein
MADVILSLFIPEGQGMIGNKAGYQEEYPVNHQRNLFILNGNRLMATRPIADGILCNTQFSTLAQSQIND